MTVIMGGVVGLSFLFAFGNVWLLALRLGVPAYVAPLVAPSVDLSVVGLLLGIRHLSAHGARPEQLRPARRLLVFASMVTLALNVSEPIITAEYGKAAFDSVGCWLLIGWAHVGPPPASHARTRTGRAGHDGRTAQCSGGRGGTRGNRRPGQRGRPGSGYGAGTGERTLDIGGCRSGTATLRR
ncbi:conserved hypothetical protein [Frankia canadensis]|uniref:DUF2637 domain-containing protein n=1 Tax=Frankia canadensis TaxID=1836972 RepID=A0A2I2L260_9ACTN|nr:conserved hypothetical protein [Frankia canadensis]SOU59291.1 conserved hypothetical protein [Frankia canadensis]